MWACVWWGGVEKWPFPSLGGRGSPLPKWAESPHRGNVNEQPHPPLHPASYLMMQQIIPLTYSRAALCDHEFYCASSTCPALRPPSDFLSSRFCERSKLETWSESSSGLGRAEPRVVFPLSPVAASIFFSTCYLQTDSPQLHLCGFLCDRNFLLHGFKSVVFFM